MKTPVLISIVVSIQFLSLFALSGAVSVGVQPRDYPYCTNGTNGPPTISCPTNSNGQWVDGVYPNPNSACSTFFFKCVNGKSYCYDCQPGLYYNPGSIECDYANNITACNGTATGAPPTTSAPTTPTTTPTTTTTIPTTTTTIPTTTTTTPTTTTTTRTTTTTTTPTTTTTRPTTPTTTWPTITRPGGGWWRCPTANGFYPITNDTCSQEYYSCVDGSPYVLKCPTDSVFDPQLLYCVNKENATCGFICPSENGFFPIPGQCSGTHYICVSWTVYTQDCPGTSIFDPVQHICLSQSNSGLSCTPGQTVSTSRPGGTTTRPSGTTTTFVCPGNGQYPYPNSCNTYYACADGDYIIAICPSNQIFYPNLEYCESPSYQPGGAVPGCNFKNLEDYYQDPNEESGALAEHREEYY